MARGREQVFVQAFVAHPPVEAFDQAILHRLTWRDAMPLDVAIFLSFEHVVRRQFGSIVPDNHTGVTAQLVYSVQFVGDTRTADGCVHDSSKALPAEAIDHVQYAEASAMRILRKCQVGQ